MHVSAQPSAEENRLKCAHNMAAAAADADMTPSESNIENSSADAAVNPLLPVSKRARVDSAARQATAPEGGIVIALCCHQVSTSA